MERGKLQNGSAAWIDEFPAFLTGFQNDNGGGLLARQDEG
jgi:hypothetical protein